MIRNILEYLEKTAEHLPDKVAFSAPEGDITFAEMRDAAKRIGTYLTRFGKCPVAVMMQKTPVSVAAFMGAVYSGNFYTPIDVTMPKERILSILHTLNPGVMVIDEKSRKVAD
ncbi:MAG: AMP-binding protein, partial [Anaerotignum sp.]|nr:AMP-binding protein [Anaerotignum sp.]